MNIVAYHIFINLLVNHVENNFVEYRQFVLIFALVRTAILFRFFPRYKRLIFFFNNIIEDHSPKWKTKKQKQRSITKPIKKNFKKDCDSVTEIFLKMTEFKKEIMLTIEIKKYQVKIEKGKKNT